MLLANAVDNLFNYIFSDWLIALIIFVAALILLAVLFKGLKVGIILLIIAAACGGAAVLAGFIMMFITWDSLRIIDFSVKWGPTILFVTMVTVSTLVNAKRGLRKSLILLAQSVGACVVCIIIYYSCVNNESVDRLIVTSINSAFHNQHWLQNTLGVGANNSTVRQILAEYLPKVIGGDIGVLIAENPQYIYTLADMGFRIVFALLTLVIYFLLVFLLYVIYFFAYPERRHKKRVNLAVTKNQTDRTYHKYHVGGGAVGLARGITAGLLSLSFIGSVFFMVAGGTGNGVSGDYDLENDEYNYYYSIYRSVESYGSQGIFKVLNSMTDANDTPFYLFAADMVLSGNLDDSENEINASNVKFREEIAAFTGFARDTLNLLMKYGENDIKPILNGDGGSGAFDKILDVMSQSGFRAEFDGLIDEFDSKTYIINLGMSLVNSVVDNIDSLSFAEGISEDNKEIIKILFKKGYLSDDIPDERDLKAQIEAGDKELTAEDIRPRIKVSHLLTKDDIQLALNIALSVAAGEIKTDDTLQTVKTLLPELKKLSILQTSRSSELDPVLARMYCYAENKYLTREGEDGITYADISQKKVKWLDEINLLLDVAGDGITLWKNIYAEGKEPLDIALSVFDDKSPNYEENVRCYDRITEIITKSDLIGSVLSTGVMYDMIYSALKNVSENIYIPDDINFSRTENADGTVTEGETYQLLCGFKLLTSPPNRDLLDKLVELGDSMGEPADDYTFELLTALSDALTAVDDKGNTLSSYFTESELLRSVLSIVMIERGEDTLYVPDVSLDLGKDGESRINLINRRELKQLLDNLSELIDFVTPLLEGENDEEHLSSIIDFLKQDKFSKLVEENRIYEGTVSNMLSIFIASNNFVKIPQNLLDSVDGWVTANGRKGELRRLLDAVRASDIDIMGILNGGTDTESIFKTVISFDTATAEAFLNSSILHYTVSDYLINSPEYGGFGITVPYGARENTPEGDVIPETVKKRELLSLFDAVSYLDLSDEINLSKVISKIVARKDIFEDSSIIAASVVRTLVSNDTVAGAISFPADYLAAGSAEGLENYNSSNLWKAELPRFINALDEILGITEAGDSFEFSAENLTDRISALMSGLNAKSTVKPEITKLSLCYLSDIVRSEITTRLDEVFVDGGIISEAVARNAKSQGYYKQSELQSLSDALDIFGVDILNADSDKIISSVTAMALRLNEPLADYEGRSALEVIYPSVIISHLFGQELDKAVQSLVDADVLAYVKGGETYPQEEVKNLVNAINEVGITDFNSIEGFDFSTVGDLTGASQTDPELSRLDVIYLSGTVAGIITKTLRDTLNSGAISEERIDHSKAYYAEVKTYKKSEIENLYVTCGTLDEVSVESINLSNLSELIYNGSGQTSSYLLAAAVSAVFKQSDRFVIPRDVLDEEGCIAPVETSLVLQVFGAIIGDGKLDNVESWEITHLPEKSVLDKMAESRIVRARVTYDLGDMATAEGKDIFVLPANVEKVTDIDGEQRLIITKEEFNALADGLFAYSPDGEFQVPSFDIDKVLGYDANSLETMLKSDIIRFAVCDCILKDVRVQAYLALNGITPDTTEAVDVKTQTTAVRQVIDDETIKDACAAINGMSL